MIIFDGIVKGLGYVWVGFGLGGKDDENRKEFGSYLRKFKIPFWSLRRGRPPAMAKWREIISPVRVFPGSVLT